MAKTTEMVEVTVSSLIPYERNAKKHPEDQIEKLKDSIQEFGFISPCLIDEQNRIIAGHGRVEAAKQLGLETVPCVYVEGLTEEQRRAYIIADNRLTELGGWDMDIVFEELTDLDDMGFNVELTGFEIPEEYLEAEEDDFDEDAVSDEPITKLGDLWQLGEHRLICGDSTDSKVFDKVMDGAMADMVFTDPPYGVAIGDKNVALNAVQKAGRCTTNIKGDTMSEDELYEMLKKAFINIREHCSDDACYFVTSPQGGSLGLMMMLMMKDAGLEVRHVLMWEKNSPTFSIGRLDYDYQHEPIFYTWTKSHHNYRNGESRSTVWKYDKPRKCDLHPTMKPVELVANAIKDGTQKGMLVLDAFGGSWTTLIAAEQLGRKCRMIELDPHYCDVIIQRWENLTGKKAVLING